MSTRSGAAGARPDKRTLLFLHIPKTAGTSVKRFLYHQLPAQACLLDPPHPEALVAADLDRYRLVAGHLDFDFAGRFGRRPFVLTCLRHPIERALSAYYYQRTPRLAIEIETIAPQIGEAAAHRIIDDLRCVNRYGTLSAFLRAEPDVARRTMGNAQTEQLAGAEAAAAHAAQPDRLVAVACEHLRACDSVLLAERLPETFALIDDGWGERARTGLPTDNATPRRPALREHTAGELDALARLTALDLTLYRLAVELIELGGPRGGAQAPFPAAPPGPADFRFDQPIPGRGWHSREFSGGTWFCWTDREAALNLDLASAGDHELRCEVTHAASPAAWADLTVSVNGHPVELTARAPAPPGEITARIPGNWLGSPPGPSCIVFRVTGTVRPSDRDSGNPDSRRLGVALSRIQLVPV
jgi:hypothetical protein